MNLEQQFKKILDSPLATLSLNDFKPIALGIWYENYTPNLDNLHPYQLQKAGYLIDRLMRFNCVSDTRSRILFQLISDIPTTLLNTTPLSLNMNVESLARKWNLNEDISHLIQPLLPFQSRHYIHS
jgi:hypothetical protein